MELGKIWFQENLQTCIYANGFQTMCPFYLPPFPSSIFFMVGPPITNSVPSNTDPCELAFLDLTLTCKQSALYKSIKLWGPKVKGEGSFEQTTIWSPPFTLLLHLPYSLWMDWGHLSPIQTLQISAPMNWHFSQFNTDQTTLLIAEINK